MSAEEWARIKTVFGAAAVLHPDERQPFVEAACPDNPAMRSAILELLDNHTDDSPDALAPAAQFLSPAFAGGDLIAGRFRVVAFLARAVWVRSMKSGTNGSSRRLLSRPCVPTSSPTAKRLNVSAAKCCSPAT